MPASVDRALKLEGTGLVHKLPMIFSTPVLHVLRDTDLRKGTLCPFCVPIHKIEEVNERPPQFSIVKTLNKLHIYFL